MNLSGQSYERLTRRILWGLVAGLAGGLAIRGLLAARPGWAHGVDRLCAEVLDPFGQIFLRLLFFVVVPLIFASLALGVLQLGRLEKLGPLAGRTFLLFGLNMAVGVALGLVMMNVLRPGGALSPGLQEQLLAKFAAPAETLQARASEGAGLSFGRLVEMFLPRNLLAAVVGRDVGRIGDILPLILFALLVGAAGTELRPEQRQRLGDALEVLTLLMTRIVGFALHLAPWAVAALLMSVVAKLGVEFLLALGKFVVGVLAVMALHLFVTMPLLLKWLSRRSPWEFFRAIRAVMVTAFSTSSSSATLPASLQAARENLGISASTAGFVLPLGATMNMSGTALYEGCVVLFVAQVYGIELGVAQQLTLLVLAVLTAVAVASVPGGSLPLIVGLLAQFGLPPEGIALVLGVDRLLDMARTVLNVSADLVTACIVDERLAPVAMSAGQAKNPP
ncbi:MAG: dicarboxylate/amino acid:cation symporter [Verrucomicrobiae bacterium]|nr:dicarboxylate/amino acid:cation symporter [Verrucomicrobiae bacterium]